jgi:hypothetical protein
VRVMTTTTSTVTIPVFQLQKDTAGNGTPLVPSAGGSATSALRTATFDEYIPWTTYVTTAGAMNFAAQDGVGDKWYVKVSTSPTAGKGALWLRYTCIEVAGVSDALTTL